METSDTDPMQARGGGKCYLVGFNLTTSALETLMDSKQPAARRTP
jgi:hypothetical protein